MTVARGATGRAEIHKRATAAPARERLRREANVLRHARHPGVVDLVEVRTDDDGSMVLVTRLAGSHTLETWTPPSLDEVAGVLVVVAETLADLHHLGLAHGALDAGHVVVDADGRPVLCGFDGSNRPRPADDVEALAHLTRHLLEPTDRGPAPTGAAPRRTSRREATARRRLLDLAEQTIVAEPAVRPGARRFAAAVLTAVPTATIVPPRVDPDDAPPPRAEPTASADPADRIERVERVDESTTRRPPRRARAGPTDDRAVTRHRVPTGRRGRRMDPGAACSTAVAVVGLALVVFGGLSAWTGARPELASPSVAAPAPTTPSPTGTPLAAPDATAPVPDAAPVDAPVGPRPCPPTGPCSVIRPGGVIDHGGARFALGDPADELAVADLRCPDPPAVVLLRRDDGATFVFDRWAAPGDDVVPRAGPRVEPGSHWEPQAPRRPRLRRPRGASTGGRDRGHRSRSRTERPARPATGGRTAGKRSRHRTRSAAVSHPRVLLRTTSWIGTLIAALVGLVAAGDRLAPPPWPAPDPSAAWHWLHRTDPALATFSILRLAAIAVVAYLLLSTLALLATRLVRVPGLDAVAARATVPATRRLVHHATGLGLVVALAGTAGPAVAGAAPVSHRPAATAAPFASPDLDPVPGPGPTSTVAPSADESPSARAAPVLRALPDEPTLVHLGPTPSAGDRAVHGRDPGGPRHDHGHDDHDDHDDIGGRRAARR